MAFPTSPTNGQIATVNGIRYSYSSSTRSWTRISNAKYTAAATAPSNPANGDQWYNTSLDILFEYLNDGTSNYWVDITSLGQAGNISIVTDSTLAGNIVLGLNNVYSIGAATGYLKNLYSNLLVANSIVVNSNISGTLVALNNVVAASGTLSSSTSTGALVVSGGTGISGNTNIGGNVTIAGNVTSNLTITGVTQHFNYMTVYSIFETANVTANAPSANLSIDVLSAPVLYFTANAAANIAINIRGNSTTSLNSILSTGQSATVAVIWQNPATPFYPNIWQVDGTSITPAWQGATAPSKGNANSTDVYSITVLKKGSASFTMLASQTQYSWLG